MNIHKEPRQEEKTQSREGDSEFRVVHWIDGAQERASDLGKCGSLQKRVDKNKVGTRNREVCTMVVTRCSSAIVDFDCHGDT